MGKRGFDDYDYQQFSAIASAFASSSWIPALDMVYTPPEIPLVSGLAGVVAVIVARYGCAP
jgi:hypothetical protein